MFTAQIQRKVRKTLVLVLVLVVSLWVLLCPMVWAQTSEQIAPHSLPNPRQTYGGWLTDQAALLTPTTEHELNRRITQLKARTTAELAIADGRMAFYFWWRLRRKIVGWKSSQAKVYRRFCPMRN